MNRLCLDLGLTNTGWAIDTAHGHIKIPSRETLSPMDDHAKQHRLAWWMRRLNGLITSIEPDSVYVEAPFISRAHPSGAMEVLKLHGVLSTVCSAKKLAMFTVENRTLKKLATGNGNASKQLMFDTAHDLDSSIETEDEADAYLLWHVLQKGLI